MTDRADRRDDRIEHWLAHPSPGHDATGVRVLDDEAEAEAYRRTGWTVDGPFVPAEQLRGAAEAERGRIAKLVRRKATARGGDAMLSDLAAHIAAGGQ